MTNDEIEQLEALCEAATPGAWEFNADCVYAPSEGEDCCVALTDSISRRDVEFIAAARTALPQLLAEVKRRDRIIWGLVRNAGRCSCERKYRWSHVCDATGLGSTASKALCRDFGADPDDLVGGADPE